MSKAASSPNTDSTKHGNEVDRERAAEILKTRASVLAKETSDTEVSLASIEVVEFHLSHESYAVEAKYVQATSPLKQLTPLPCTPSFVLGIVNLRGRILTIIDIKKFFDLPERGITDLNKVIVLKSDDVTLGILADEVVGTQTISLPAIQPPLPTLTGLRAEYLRGVTKERLIILDPEKILTDRRIIVHEQVEV